jgi:hypothetical protein
MKRYKTSYLLLIVLTGILGFNCGNGAVKGRDTSAAAASPAADGNATFSCKIDGTPITGSGIDELQQRNTAFIYPVPVTGDHVMFTLASTKDGSDPKPDYSIRIYCPRKEGTYVITDADDDAENHNYVTVDFLSGDFSRYRMKSVTVTVTAIGNSRVSGTFSGTLSLSNDTPRGIKKEITLSDGKFDIPFSTGNLRPL